MGFHFLALVAVLSLGVVRLSPGPLREWKDLHISERLAFKTTSTTLSKAVDFKVLPEWLSKRLAGVAMCETSGVILIALTVLPGAWGTYLFLVMELIIGSTQTLWSFRMFVSLGYCAYVAVVLQFRSLTFRPLDVAKSLRKELDDELASLQADVVEQISSTRRALLKVKSD